MMDWERLRKSAAAVADSALRTTASLAEKGKQQVDRLSLENKLRKAQQELGALVYSLHKNGEENPALVQRYVDVVADVESQLNALCPTRCPRPNRSLWTAAPSAARRWSPVPPFVVGVGQNWGKRVNKAYVYHQGKHEVHTAKAKEPENAEKSAKS